MPRFSAAHSNLGSVFKEQGKLDQSVAHYLEAISIDPQFADAYCNLGNAYKDLGNWDEALSCYKTALSLEPQYVEALVCLGGLFKDSNRLAEAATTYRKALETRPDCAEALANLVHTNVLLCDWRDRDNDFARLAQLVANQLGQPNNGSNANPSQVSQNTSKLQRVLPAVQPFHCLVYPVSLLEMLLIAKRFAHHARVCVSLCDLPAGGYKYAVNSNNSGINSGANTNSATTSALLHSASISNLNNNGNSSSIASANNTISSKLALQCWKNGGRLRVGYVSSDFNNHPLGQLLHQSLFLYHNRDKFEVFLYATTPSDGSYTRHFLEENVEHFLDVSNMHSADLARHIHDVDKIHILVNLNGYTKGARNEVFALRPAPVQTQFLGFCGSLGADYIHYIVCDTVVIPKHLRSFYSEKTLNLPHSYFANSHKQCFGEAQIAQSLNNLGKTDPTNNNSASNFTRRSYGLSEDAFVFANFNQNYKIDPETFACWMRILKRVEHAVLWLLRFPASAEAHLRQEARKHGVRDNRLVFSDVVCREEHIHR